MPAFCSWFCLPIQYSNKFAGKIDSSLATAVAIPWNAQANEPNFEKIILWHLSQISLSSKVFFLIAKELNYVANSISYTDTAEVKLLEFLPPYSNMEKDQGEQ